MVDNELKSCNAILEDAGGQTFASTGVQGIESPRLLSKTVRVEGWTPVSAEVKVSDPVHLARTLGGRNLYGFGAIAPVRELLQNAVDAVRARRAHQSRENNWGKVRLIIERSEGESRDIWLHVDDMGIGMSERVVTGPLIDFGKSFWSSALMDEEFPGLRSSAPKLVGKFGIGFFSVFLLGDAVRVITRRFDAAEESAAVLSFDELTRRPLLRRAATGELPIDYTTRVSVKLNERSCSEIEPRQMGQYRAEHSVDFTSIVVHLIASTDVDIEIIDRIHGTSRTHSGSWLISPPKNFLDEVCALQDPKEIAKIVESHEERVRLIVEDDGTIVGRAALIIPPHHGRNLCLTSVGGFTSQQNTGERLRYLSMLERSNPFEIESVLGVILGDTSDIARARATIGVSKEAIARWAQEQDELIDVERFTPLEMVQICHGLLKLGAESSRLPFGFLAGKFASVSEFRKAISESQAVDIPISHSDYKNSLEFRSITSLNTGTYIHVPVYPLDPR
jgi:hypothetical protein